MSYLIDQMKEVRSKFQLDEFDDSLIVFFFFFDTIILEPLLEV